MRFTEKYTPISRIKSKKFRFLSHLALLSTIALSPEKSISRDICALSARVMVELLNREHTAHVRLAGRIADHRGTHAQKRYGAMPGALHMRHRHKSHVVADVQAIRRRIKPDVKSNLFFSMSSRSSSGCEHCLRKPRSSNTSYAFCIKPVFAPVSLWARLIIHFISIADTDAFFNRTLPRLRPFCGIMRLCRILIVR